VRLWVDLLGLILDAARASGARDSAKLVADRLPGHGAGNCEVKAARGDDTQLRYSHRYRVLVRFLQVRD
jgi:hypothetical protein